MARKNASDQAILKEFLDKEYKRLNAIHHFSSNNEFYLLISDMYGFGSLSTIRRAFLGLYEVQTSLELTPTKQISLNL